MSSQIENTEIQITTEKKRVTIKKSNASSFTSQGKKPGCGLLQFATLKILFIDLVVAFGDTGADFAQAYLLCTHEDEDLRIYGYVTMAIHWIPGIVAAVHCISTKRAEYGVAKTLIWAGKADFNHVQGPQLVRFFGPQETALLEKSH